MFGSRERLYNGWVRDHYRFLFRTAWALTGLRAVAEEVVQDCFEIAWRQMDQLREREFARAWLFRILRHEALRHVRGGGGAQLEPYDEERDQRTAGDDIAVAEQRMDILRALQVLPPIHREVLTLFYFEDMPVAEMAVALDVAPGTVLSRLDRAREALRRQMQPPAGGDSEPRGSVVDIRSAATRVVRGD